MDALTALRGLVACEEDAFAHGEWTMSPFGDDSSVVDRKIRRDAAWAAARAVLNDYDAEGKAGDLMGRYPKPLESGAQRATDASGAQQVASLAQAGDSPVGEEAAGTNPDCQHRQRESRALPNSSASPSNDAGVALFQRGQFRLHSGEMSSFKIDCDALSGLDIEALAELIAERIKFSAVEGVPRGGLRLADALTRHVSNGPLLIVDDVLTTGNSMEQQRAGREAIGVVIFARGAAPSWVRPLFRYDDAGVAKEVDAANYVHVEGAPSNPASTLTWVDADGNTGRIDYDADAASQGAGRALAVGQHVERPLQPIRPETQAGSAASPLPAATPHIPDVDGPSQEGAGDPAATPSLDDLVARLRMRATDWREVIVDREQAADALVELRLDLDNLQARLTHWRERAEQAEALLAAATKAGTQMQQERDAANARSAQAEARASALHDDAERYRWLRGSFPVPLLMRLSGLNDRANWDEYIDAGRQAGRANMTVTRFAWGVTGMREVEPGAVPADYVRGRDYDAMEVHAKALHDDAERFVYWFSPAAKSVNIKGFLTGVREDWSLDQWRTFLDSTRLAKPVEP